MLKYSLGFSPQGPILIVLLLPYLQRINLIFICFSFKILGLYVRIQEIDQLLEGWVSYACMLQGWGPPDQSLSK